MGGKKRSSTASKKKQEEAEEIKDINDEEPQPESEESGENLEEDIAEDYQPIEEIDKYEHESADDEEPEDIQPEEKKKADKEIDQRLQKTIPPAKRVPTALVEEIEESSESELRRELKKERQHIATQLVGAPEEMDEEKYLDIEEVKGHPRDWIREPRTIRWIKKTFSQFLRHFKDDENTPVYEWRINEMCTNNKQSLEVTYSHISKKYPSLALWIATDPINIFTILNEVAMEVVKEIFPSYENIHKEIFVRIKDLPVEDKIRELRQVHLNELVKIKGVVTKRSNVFPQLKKMYFICVKCGNRLGPIFLGNSADVKLGTCVICQSQGPYVLDAEDTLYRNYQIITVQETPGTVQPGRVPRQKEVTVLNDLIDMARPGDEVEITGIYTNRFDFNLNVKHGFPVFTTIIEANNIKKMADIEIN